MSLVFTHGHLVIAQSRHGLAIAIVLSDDGMEYLTKHPQIEEMLTQTYLCDHTFERQQDHLGTIFVCKADSRDQIRAEFEIQDLQETLENEYGLILRTVDGRYCRQVHLRQVA
jgi:hypothetical protein